MMGTYDESTPQDASSFARMAQIIAGSLVAGSSIFLIIALIIRASGRDGLFADRPWDILPPKGLITLIGLIFAAMTVVLSFVVPRSVVANIRKAILLSKAREGSANEEPGSLNFYNAFNTKMIVGLALLEGAAFFNGIAFLLEGHIPSLIAVAVLIGLMLARFPTQSGIASWVEDQESTLRDERFGS